MRDNFAGLLNLMQYSEPNAYALVYGGNDKIGNICGYVRFYALWGGTLAVTEVSGLPNGGEMCGGRFFGFHIHEGSSCANDGTEPYAKTGSHYNPDNCDHPSHAGDLPALLGNKGYALSIVFTDRFIPEEIIGRTVVIHEMPDDYRTQPSGASGTKIACGEIRRMQ